MAKQVRSPSGERSKAAAARCSAVPPNPNPRTESRREVFRRVRRPGTLTCTLGKRDPTTSTYEG
eukprot:2926483-Pyramimonas_sp.AAC.1